MLTTDNEWDQLTAREKLERLRNVELDRDNLRAYVKDLIWKPAPDVPVPITVHEPRTLPVFTAAMRPTLGD